MKKLQEEAKCFFEEEKYNLIMLSDQCDNNSQLYPKINFAPIRLLLAISTLAHGARLWSFENLKESLSLDNRVFDNRVLLCDGYNRICDYDDPEDAIISFLNYAEEIKNKKLFSSMNIERKTEIQKKFKFYTNKLEKNIRPHLHEANESHLQITFTDYPPCAKIFLSIYQRDRDKNFFKSTGFYSRFFRGEYQEMHLRMESSEFLTFEKVLEYGVKYPKSRTASILQKYFKTYWDEAIDKRLKDNLSQKNYPNVLDGLIIRDLQPIVKGYLFSS